MKRVIKDFKKIEEEIKYDVFGQYLEGLLERTTVPVKGKMRDAVIYKAKEEEWLIPLATIRNYNPDDPEGKIKVGYVIKPKRKRKKKLDEDGNPIE